MYCIIGLGNPEKKYHYTRHNIGFRFIDKMVLDMSRENDGYYIQIIDYNDKPLCLVKPMLGMNNSGSPIEKLKFIGVIDKESPKLLVVHDDVDLPFGEIRLSFGSSSAGHNGVKSIINAFGSNQFSRLRIGIGPRPSGDKMLDYVLGDFTNEEDVLINKEVLDNAKLKLIEWYK